MTMPRKAGIMTKKTGEFTEHVYVEPEPAPPPDTTMEEYLIDLDFRLSNIELGL